jgi:uncharacterized membrane protein YphA (DoxX/SURF4 family)
MQRQFPAASCRLPAQGSGRRGSTNCACGLRLSWSSWAGDHAVALEGGFAILFGLFTRPVGLLLAIWCVATALIAHTNFADRNQEIHFLKNMAMVGGFLYVAAFGGGACCDLNPCTSPYPHPNTYAPPRAA